MKNNDYGKSKTVRFLTGRGFYFVLGLCMVAIGIAAWSMASTISSPPITGSDLSSGTINSGGTSSKEHQAGTTVSGINASSSKSSSSSTTATSSQAVETAAPIASFFVLPVTGDILKDFSSTELKYSQTYGDSRLHEAIDIAANAGTAVKAAGAGRVTEVKKDPLLGTMVVINHGNGVIGYYCGLTDKTSVKKGQNVNANDQIGSIGTIPSESVDAPHLHLAFTKDGKSISPLSLVNMENANG